MNIERIIILLEEPSPKVAKGRNKLTADFAQSALNLLPLSLTIIFLFSQDELQRFHSSEFVEGSPV